MKKQNYKNHKHLVPLYHVVNLLAMLVTIIGSVISIFNSDEETVFISYLLLLISLTIVSASFHNRSFALRAQDRAIRAEENLRYFILTGKKLDPRITMKQIIGLRFAEDIEFVTLADKAVKENMSQKEIKKAIVNWKPDHHRA